MSQPADEAVVGLVRELKGWKSIEFTVRVDSALNSGTLFGSEEQHYIETSEGLRLLDIQGNLPGPHRSTAYSDGKQCAYVEYSARDNTFKQLNIYTTRIFMREHLGGATNRPFPLKSFYAGQVPLHEALPSAIYQGQSRCLDRPCHVFLLPRSRWGVAPGHAQDLVFHLDEQTSVPLKLEVVRHEEPFSAKQRDATWVAESLDSVGSYHVVKRSRIGGPDETHNGITYPGSTDHYEVQSIRFDESYPIATFRPVADASVTVIDSIAKKVTPGTTSTARAVPNPLRADAPDRWGSTIALTVLVLGVVVLAAGVVLRLRRR